MRTPRIRRVAPLVALMALATLAAGGCGMQGQMLGAEQGLLLQGFDSLTHPGQEVMLSARLQGGDYLQGVEGYLVGFYRVDHKLGELRTDQDGLVELPFVPPAPGNHAILARLEDPDARKLSVEAAEIVVAAHPADAPMAVVDLDHTLVASGFDEVLAGTAEPMADSVRVMRRIAAGHAIIYLTHRPEMFTATTKRWIRKHDYPVGPLLTSTLGEFFSGSGQYKSAALAALAGRYSNLQVGIGDKASDAAAYAANGLRAILIIHPDMMETPEAVRVWIRDIRRLPSSVQVVESWTEVERVLFQNASFPPSEAIGRLEELARRRAAGEQMIEGGDR